MNKGGGQWGGWSLITNQWDNQYQITDHKEKKINTSTTKSENGYMKLEGLFTDHKKNNLAISPIIRKYMYIVITTEYKDKIP